MSVTSAWCFCKLLTTLACVWTGTTWEADIKTHGISTQALVISASEYCVHVWSRSPHFKNGDVATNSSLRCVCVCVCVCVRACVRPCMRVRVRACVGVCLCKYVSESVSTHARMHACTHARMHACTHARMHACTHASMHACTHARTHACTHARMHACTHARMHACTHARMHASTHARMHACTHARMHACTHARMHACTHSPIHACTHARMHACTHARMHACTHARMHACTHPIPVCVCTVCAYTCVTILNYAEVLVFFAEDWCNLRCAEIHASQILQILFTTVKKQLSKRVLSISTEPIAILIQLLRCQYVSGHPAVHLISHVINF